MPHKDLPSYFVMFGACICIILLVAARHHPPSRQKIKEIWHGRVYWLDDNTTLTPNLRSVAPMNETVKEVQRPEPLREVTIKTVTRKIDLPSDKKSIVMMDDRPFSYWQPTLVSAIKYTSSDWGIELFVSKQYGQFALVKKFLDSTGRRTRLNHYDMHFNKKDKHRSINSLLKQETFWETIEAESIFFIQPDGVVCRNGIDEFLEYDYVGAPWAHRPDGLVQGNGGMSLRKRSFMLDCLKNYHKHDNDPEDVYFSNCAKDRGVSADLANSKRFGMEAIWSKDSITIHQLYFQPKLTLGRTKAKVFEDICAQCPEIMEIPYFKATPYFKAKFVISDGRPLLNILTRTTSSRVEQFDRLSKSIEKQTIAPRHIISSEDRATDKTDMTDIFFVEHENRGTGCHKQVSLSAGKGCCPYNKHLNVLKNQVKKGWVLILDDDSLILSDTFVERLTNHLEKTKTNKIVVFPAKYGPNNRQLPAAHHIKFGDIDMANFVVHISNIRDYTFTSDCGGDFRFLKHLMQKGLKVDWFDMKVAIHANINGAQQGVLAASQECPCYDQRIDKLGVVGVDPRPALFKGLFERHRWVCAVFKHKIAPSGNWLYFGPEKTHISILRQKWPDVTFTGIDYFAEGYQYEKNTLQGDVQDLYNIKSNTYDGIIILHVLEHVASIKKSLSELHRILKPGGKIIHETPCQTNSKSFKCDGHRDNLICKQFDHYWGYNCDDLHDLISTEFSCENIDFSDTIIKKYAMIHENSKTSVERGICTKNIKDLVPKVKECALLFFGLAKHFNDIVFPSIQKYILDINPDCDVYAHTYDIKNITNPRNNEDHTPVNPLEVYSMTNNVQIDTLDSVSKAIDFEYYHKNYVQKDGVFPWSMDNSLKQWYSIQRVWDSMTTKYERIGLFRLDVLYTEPIDISDGDAVIPDFLHFGGLNDRAFYGLYKWASQWATTRLKKLAIRSKEENIYDMHAETFMKYLMRDVPVELKPMCFKRVRATGEIKPDCKPSVPDEVVQAIVSTISNQSNVNSKEHIKVSINPQNIQKSWTSNVRPENGFILKTLKGRASFRGFNLIKREKCVLDRLAKFKWAPDVISTTDNSITMTYVGEKVNKENIPLDYADQMNQILTDMESMGVKHNDILYPCSAKSYHKHEVMVFNGRLSLVDFGTATINDGVPCGVSTKKFVPNWNPCPDKTILQVLKKIAVSKTRNTILSWLQDISSCTKVVAWKIDRDNFLSSINSNDDIDIFVESIEKAVSCLGPSGTRKGTHIDAPGITGLHMYDHVPSTNLPGIKIPLLDDIFSQSIPVESFPAIRTTSLEHACILRWLEYHKYREKKRKHLIWTQKHCSQPFTKARIRWSDLLPRPIGSTVNCVVEIPKGSTSKYEIDTEFIDSPLKVSRVLEKPIPANYGFIPQTYVSPDAQWYGQPGDGDPLDCIVIGDPIKTGTVVVGTVLGVLEFYDSGEMDWKIITRAENSGFPDIKMLRDWFNTYKIQKVASPTLKFDYGNKDIANAIIRQTHGYWTRSTRNWEAHIFIDWYSALSRSSIEKQLPPTINIIDTWQRSGITNENERFKTLKSFYGVPVRDERFKKAYSVYLLNDTAPLYLERKTTKGQRIVNSGIFDLKKYFRTKGHRVHATDNIQETRDNMKVLKLKYPEKYKFETMEQVFKALNNEPGFSYVVLRNFDGLLTTVQVDEHFELQLLVSDYYAAKRILDAVSKTGDRYEDGKWRIQNKFKVGNDWVQTDLRSVGDDYYDKEWESDMLATRAIYNNVVFVPSKENHKYSLAYHALIQKSSISKTYTNILQEIFKSNELQDWKHKLGVWLNNKGYKYVRALDKSVQFNKKI